MKMLLTFGIRSPHSLQWGNVSLDLYKKTKAPIHNWTRAFAGVDMLRVSIDFYTTDFITLATILSHLRLPNSNALSFACLV